jgi:cyclic pyranopterin phosphate synthase
MSLGHLDEEGRARMVDVGAKPPSRRLAVAEGTLRTAPATLGLLASAPKGDVLAAARIAGIMAAKRTAELIPLCHPLPLASVAVEIEPDPTLPGLRLRATAATTGSTGVEMEALTAVAVAGLTLYDMLKSADRGMVLGEIRLRLKEGGASGRWEGP